MEPEHAPEAVREVRLEGLGLFAVLVLVLGLMVGSFFLGRWSGAGASPAPLEAARTETPSSGTTTDRPSYFDAAQGAEQEREPAREVRRQPAPRPSPPPAEPAAPSSDATDAAATAAEAAPASTSVGSAATLPPAGAEPAPATPPAPGAAPSGTFWVQVAAGRDRVAAEALVERLRGEGFPVRLFSEPEGSGELLRVRVGSYASEDDARAAVAALKARGHEGAWVAR